MQMLIINSIAKIKDPATIPALITILQSETTSARDFASDALRNIGSPAVPALLEALNNSDSSSRALSAWTLGLIKDPIAVEPLIARLDDKGVSNIVISNAGRSINTIAAQALERIGTPEARAAVEEWRKQQGNAQS